LADLISQSAFTQAMAAAGAGGVTLSAAQLVELPSLISAASQAIERHCGRYFAQADYDEVRVPQPGQWDKGDPDTVFLSQLPVLSVPTVQGNRSLALTVTNTDATTNQRAYLQVLTLGDPSVQLWPCGLSLTRVASAVTTTASFTFLPQPPSGSFSVAAGTGGSIAAGTYPAAITWVNPAGETVASATANVTVGANGTIAFTLGTLPHQAASANLYVGTAGGNASTLTLQQSGVTGATATLSALTTSGAAPPSTPTGTVTQLAAAVNALGGGWQATVSNPFGPWPAAELVGGEGAMGCLTGQTAALGQLAVFASDVPLVRCSRATGELALPSGTSAYGGGPGNFWQWPGSSDVQMGGAWRGEVRVRYTAGFAAVPLDVQQAAVELVKAMFERLARDSTLSAESAKDYSYTAREEISLLPKSVQRTLSRYRVYRA
jgi:hypothetical protein